MHMELHLTRSLNLIKRNLLGPLIKFIFVKLRLNNKFRFLETNAASIGHLCVDVDCFLKESTLTLIFTAFCWLMKKVANRSLISLWKSKQLRLLNTFYVKYLIVEFIVKHIMIVQNTLQLILNQEKYIIC